MRKFNLTHIIKYEQSQDCIRDLQGIAALNAKKRQIIRFLYIFYFIFGFQIKGINVQ